MNRFLLVSSISISLFSSCKKIESIEIQFNPKGFTSNRCLNNAGAGPIQKSQYQNLVWADEFNGPEPTDNPDCFTMHPQCVKRLDWPGSSKECPKDFNAVAVKDLNKCKWQLWNGYSTWDLWPKDRFAYQSNQVSVRDGSLVFKINHIPQKPGAKCGIIPGEPELSDNYYGTDCEWVSGGVDSSGADPYGNQLFKGRNIRYGRVEIKAKIPSGVGIYPALWTWANNKNSGYPYKNANVNAPNAGEFDILESVTRESGRIQAFQTYHDWGYTPKNHQQVGSGTTYLQPDTWYRFGMERFGNKVRFYIDDCYTNEVVAGEKDVRFNDLAQYLIMNLAIESKIVNNGIPKELDGKEMFIDYVRIYE